MKTEEKPNSVETAKKTLVKLAMDCVQRSGVAMIELEGADDVAAAVEMTEEGLGKLVLLPKQRTPPDDYGIFGPRDVAGDEESRLGFETMSDENDEKRRPSGPTPLTALPCCAGCGNFVAKPSPLCGEQILTNMDPDVDFCTKWIPAPHATVPAAMVFLWRSSNPGNTESQEEIHAWNSLYEWQKRAVHKHWQRRLAEESGIFFEGKDQYVSSAVIAYMEALALLQRQAPEIVSRLDSIWKSLSEEEQRKIIEDTVCGGSGKAPV